jgi:hypothetical protein
MGVGDSEMMVTVKIVIIKHQNVLDCAGKTSVSSAVLPKL